MINEAIILAGGLGTRLRAAVPDLPKSMANIAGRPFLSYVIHYYSRRGINRFIFSLGYRHEVIESFLAEAYPHLNYSCSIEDEPLGTGGAILKACALANAAQVLVMNGDTLFEVNVNQLSEVHEKNDADCTLALKPMKNSDRYGVVELGEANLITSFREKKWYEESLINGGVYALNRERFMSMPLPEKFSFEKDYLEKTEPQKKLCGTLQDGYFIDIGIPEDYERAQTELIRTWEEYKPLDLADINNQWTLFLDRDGVINVDKSPYTLNADEFEFYHGVPEAIAEMSRIFKHVIVVTNQRGVGRNLMTEADLLGIHEKMVKGIISAGGKIDKIYYCTSIDNEHPNRKPNPGMAFEAIKDYPDIIPHQSLIVGNNLSDMKFGRNAGFYTALVTTTGTSVSMPDPLVDLQYASLPALAADLKKVFIQK